MFYNMYFVSVQYRWQMSLNPVGMNQTAMGRLGGQVVFVVVVAVVEEEVESRFV